MTKCSKCEYEWVYKGKHYWSSCPRCMAKQKVKEEEEQDER